MIEHSKENYTKNIIKGISVVALYFIFSLFKNLPLEILNIHYENLNITAKIIYNLSAEIIMILIIYIIFQKEISNAIKDIKKNHLTYFKKYLKVYLLGVFIMMLSNMIIMALGGGSSENETLIRNEFQLYPVYIYISSVFLAPVLEESIFRLGFRAIFKNNTLFILASGLVFGSLHLMGMPFDNLFPIYLLSYCSCGIAFAYIMAKTNNIFVSMGFHFMHNGILMSMQTLILLFS